MKRVEARLARWFVLALPVIALGCDTKVTPPDGGTSTELTLDTCATSIAAGVPDFFRTYFKCVSITTSADKVVITTEDLPPHRSYYYGAGNPNYADFDTSRGAQYRPNPNRITQKHHTFSIPLNPTSRGLTVTGAMVDRMANTNPNEYPLGPVGVALDSVDVFNDQAAPGDNIDNEAYTFDSYNAHPTMNGDYHYHTVSPGPLEVMKYIGRSSTTAPGGGGVELYGIMCDGTLVLGCSELDGSTPASSGFDAQNGHIHDIKDADGTVHFTSRYHTHVCPQTFTAHKYTPEIQFYTTCSVAQ